MPSRGRAVIFPVLKIAELTLRQLVEIASEETVVPAMAKKSRLVRE